MNIKNLKDGHFLFTSESVTDGNPDKLCDLIADSIVDSCLEQDSNSKVSVEVIAKSNMLVVAGNIITTAKINIDQIVRGRIKEIGYDDEKKGLNYSTCEIITKINYQNENNLKNDEDLFVFDQGNIFGYSTDETKELFPLSHFIALRLTEKLTEVRKNKAISWIRPDGKVQVTVEYKKDGVNIHPVRIHTVLLSVQHEPEVASEEIKNDLFKHILKPVIPDSLIDEKTLFTINPSGSFIVGGPEGDTGISGRKIIVDSYGGWGSHGGGSFSGKDSSRFERSGSYLARWIAKSVVYNGLCKRCLVQIAYCIGNTSQFLMSFDSYGSSQKGKNDTEILEIIKNNFSISPIGIIRELRLKRPIYSKTSVNGHFGRNDNDFSWEEPKKLNY